MTELDALRITYNLGCNAVIRIPINRIYNTNRALKVVKDLIQRMQQEEDKIGDNRD